LCDGAHKDGEFLVIVLRPVFSASRVQRASDLHPVDRFDSEGWFSSDQVIF